MEPKVIVILGLVGLVIFLFIVMGIIAWVSSGDDESTDDSTTGGSTTGGSTNGTSGGTTGGDNTGGDNTGGDNTGGDNTGGDNTGDVETCEDPEIHCSGTIYWPAIGSNSASIHNGKECSEAKPGNLMGQTAEDGSLHWLARAYQAGSNHKLIVKDRYGEICRDKEVICKGDSVDWPAVDSHSASEYNGQDCSAHAIAHNSGNNNKSLESYAALNWCRKAEEYDTGCTIGVVDKN